MFDVELDDRTEAKFFFSVCVPQVSELSNTDKS